MNRKLIRIILLSLLVCGLGAFWAAREAIDKMEAAVVDRAAARGVQLEWDKVEWHHDGLTLRQLTASNDRFELDIERVDIEFDYFRWHQGRPRVQAVSVFRPRLMVRDHKATRSEILQPKTSGHQLPHQPLPLKDVGLDRVQVLGGGVTLSRDGTTIVDIELLEASIDLSSRQPQLSLSARYKSLYTGAGAVSVTSTYQPAQSVQRIRTRPLVVGEPILQARLGSYFVRVDALELGLDMRDLRKSRLALFDTQIQTPRFTLELENWSLEGPFERPSMHLEGGDLRVKSDVANSRATVKGGPKVESLDRQTMIPMPKPLVSYLAQGGRLSWARVGVERSGWPTLDNISGSTDLDGANITLDTVGGRVEFEVDWDLYNGSVNTVFWNIKKLNLARVVNEYKAWLDETPLVRLQPIGELSSRGRLGILGDALSPMRRVVTSATLSCSKCGWTWAPFSPQPITGLEFEARVTTAYDELLETMSPDMTLSLGAVHLDVSLEYKGQGRTRYLRFEGAGRPVSCQTALNSLPEGILGAYSAIELSGEMKPWVKFNWPLHASHNMRTSFGGIIQPCRVEALNAASMAWPSVRFRGSEEVPLDDVDWLNRPFVLKVGEGVYGKRKIEVGPGTTGFVKLSSLPSHVGGAAYLSEEVYFPRNRAIDRGLISRAIRLNLIEKRFVYGGSTVTQQLVKNLFLTRDKSIARKIQEVLISKRITQMVSRNRVLELYLNCIEFGHNIYGIGKAARHYFQKSAKALKPKESVFLALIKPSPRSYTNIKRRGRTPAGRYWHKKSKIVMERMIRRNMVTEEEADLDRPFELFWRNGRYVESPTSDTPL